MKRRKFLKETAGAATSLAVMPVFSPFRAKKKKPNIVFILTDQWRASATGYAGDPNVRTPILDKLEKECFNFRNAVSVCPVCTPYRAALMTGKYPTSTGMFLNDAYLPDDELCMAEVFSEAGYKTAYIGKWHLDGHGRSAFIPPERRQGFQYWKAAECSHNYNHSHYYTGSSDEKLFWEGYDVYAQTNDAQRFIVENARKQDPFFLFVSFGTPHYPHETAPKDLKEHYPPDKIKLPPNVPDTMQAEARNEAQGYYAHCEAIDNCLGDLIRTLEQEGLHENTIVIFTSDHGEMLGSHGVKPKQKQVAFNEAAGVPFLLRYPAIHGETGKTINMPITTPDIFPTLLGLCGISMPRTIEGENHSDLIRGRMEDKDYAALYMQVAPWVKSEFGREYRAIRTSRYTYVRSIDGPWLLFDNSIDPFQMNNLIGDPVFSPLVSDMENKLQNLLKRIDDDFRPGKSYVEEWGFRLADHGSLPYDGLVEKPQAPVRKQ